jgi:hypothetical protein
VLEITVMTESSATPFGPLLATGFFAAGASDGASDGAADATSDAMDFGADLALAI